MDFTKLSKLDLLHKCEEKGITKCKSKTKSEIIKLLNNDKEPEMTHLKPLIKWSGGKSDEIKMFIHHLPDNHTTYIEPFVGGGSLYFYLNPENAIISDVHTELIDLYRSIGEGKGNEIYEFMEQTPNEEAIYYKVRDEMVINDSLDSAKRFYYQRKTCFRGMLRYNKN